MVQEAICKRDDRVDKYPTRGGLAYLCDLHPGEMRRADRIMLFKYPSASLRRSRRAIFPRSRRDSLFERRRAVRPIHIVQVGEVARLRAWRPIPQQAPEDDGDPNNSGTTSAESFSARIREPRWRVPSQRMS